MSSFADESQRKLDGARENVRKVSAAFKIKRFDLSAARSKNDFQADNLFPYMFKSFWIVDTNNKSFIAKMFVNTKGDGGDPLPLRPNMSIKFDYRQDGCALEFPAQPGVWVDVIFAFDSDVEPGSVQLDSSGITTISEGSTFTDGNLTIGNTGATILLAANSSRKKAVVQNTSGVTVWIGSQASLAHADYQKKCLRIDSGDLLEWKSSAQLNARVEAGTTDSVAIMEMF